MKTNPVKLKRGGIDTIVAYIVVMLPLLYVLIYMVATIYHFSVQMYLNQVVKEAVVMASTYGEITSEHKAYIEGKLKDVFDPNPKMDNAICTVSCYIREFDDDLGVVTSTLTPYPIGSLKPNKGDIVGIQVMSTMPSMLGNVSNFSFFGDPGDTNLYYTSYREEIIRNEAP